MTDFTLRPFRDALVTLEEALQTRPLNDIVRDATIQRFEYTYELAWKSLKRVLENEFGVRDLPVKDLWREAFRLNLVSHLELWFEFHRGRNLTSHVYSKKTSREVFAIAKKFPAQAKKLIAKLEKFETESPPRKNSTQPRASKKSR